MKFLLNQKQMLKLSDLPPDLPKMKRQTHMQCTICLDIAETYDQKECNKCKSIYKWSIPWKNSPETHSNSSLSSSLSLS